MRSRNLVSLIQDTRNNEAVVGCYIHLGISHIQQAIYLFGYLLLIIIDVLQCRQLLLLAHLVYITIHQYQMLGGDAAVQFVCLYHLNIRHLSLEMGIAGLCRQFHAFTAKQGTHAVFRNGWEHGECIVVRLLRFGLLIDGFGDFQSQAIAYQDGDSALTR